MATLNITDPTPLLAPGADATQPEPLLSAAPTPKAAAPAPTAPAPTAPAPTAPAPTAPAPTGALTPPSPPLEAPTAAITPTTPQPIAEADLTSGRMEKLLAPGNDNPYLEQARASASQTANARGLLNTSMAVGAGEAAAIAAAGPIAQADAAAILQTKLANLSAETQTNFANLDAKLRPQLQASASAGQVYANAMIAMSNIITSPDLDAESKELAIQQIISGLNASNTFFGVAGNNPDIGAVQFDVTTVGAPKPTPETAPAAKAKAESRATIQDQIDSLTAELRSGSLSRTEENAIKAKIKKLKADLAAL